MMSTVSHYDSPDVLGQACQTYLPMGVTESVRDVWSIQVNAGHGSWKIYVVAKPALHVALLSLGVVFGTSSLPAGLACAELTAWPL